MSLQTLYRQSARSRLSSVKGPATRQSGARHIVRILTAEFDFASEL
jgi:hypothetical protein